MKQHTRRTGFLCLLLALLAAVSLTACDGDFSPPEQPGNGGYSVSTGETEGLEVHFIDVGQADAALVICGGEAMLIDGGNVDDSSLIYACNMGVDDLMNGIENNKYFPLVKARAEVEGAEAIPICAKTEEDIAEYTAEEKAEFLAEMGIEASGLDNLIAASYSLLGLISFLTDGKKECRAWTIKRGTKAPQAAGKIHSDFERGFIRAEVCNFDTLMDCGGKMAEVKARGLYRSEGKEYVVQDGDIIEFLFNV